MDIKMIVIDLDQTLLRTDKTISNYTLDVLTRCREIGKKIVYATARSTQSSSRFLERFRPDIFVGYGGALVLAGDEVIHRFDISSDISSRLINECLTTSEISSILAINESVALTNNKDTLSINDLTHYKYTDFQHNHNHSYLKISVYSSSQIAVEKIAAQFPMCDLLRYTGEDLYRFANCDALKWNALEAIAQHYHLHTNMFVAFGDDVNDLEMVEKCGVGIAVTNAIDEVKAVADDVCDSNDQDGVAKWLEKNIL